MIFKCCFTGQQCIITIYVNIFVLKCIFRIISAGAWSDAPILTLADHMPDYTRQVIQEM